MEPFQESNTAMLQTHNIPGTEPRLMAAYPLALVADTMPKERASMASFNFDRRSGSLVADLEQLVVKGDPVQAKALQKRKRVSGGQSSQGAHVHDLLDLTAPSPEPERRSPRANAQSQSTPNARERIDKLFGQGAILHFPDQNVTSELPSPSAQIKRRRTEPTFNAAANVSIAKFSGPASSQLFGAHDENEDAGYAVRRQAKVAKLHQAEAIKKKQLDEQRNEPNGLGQTATNQINKGPRFPINRLPIRTGAARTPSTSEKIRGFEEDTGTPTRPMILGGQVNGDQGRDAAAYQQLSERLHKHLLVAAEFRNETTQKIARLEAQHKLAQQHHDAELRKMQCERDQRYTTLHTKFTMLKKVITALPKHLAGELKSSVKTQEEIEHETLAAEESRRSLRTEWRASRERQKKKHERQIMNVAAAAGLAIDKAEFDRQVNVKLDEWALKREKTDKQRYGCTFHEACCSMKVPAKAQDQQNQPEDDSNMEGQVSDNARDIMKRQHKNRDELRSVNRANTVTDITQLPGYGMQDPDGEEAAESLVSEEDLDEVETDNGEITVNLKRKEDRKRILELADEINKDKEGDPLLPGPEAPPADCLVNVYYVMRTETLNAREGEMVVMAETTDLEEANQKAVEYLNRVWWGPAPIFYSKNETYNLDGLYTGAIIFNKDESFRAMLTVQRQTHWVGDLDKWQEIKPKPIQPDTIYVTEEIVKENGTIQSSTWQMATTLLRANELAHEWVTKKGRELCKNTAEKEGEETSMEYWERVAVPTIEKSLKEYRGDKRFFECDLDIAIGDFSISVTTRARNLQGPQN